MALSASTGVQLIVIQSALVFLLGILCTVFLILLAAPLFWKRAHFLWQKQMAARLPLSLTAIEADRDLLRASHALALRKAEMQTAHMRDKHTQAQLKISVDCTELEKLPILIQQLEALKHELQNERQQRKTQSSELQTLLGQHQNTVQDNGRLQRHNEALSLLRDTLQLEIAGKDMETERLRRESADLRQEKKQLNNAKSELASQVAVLKTSLESEKNRNQALEDKLHQLIAQLADTQEKLEYQSKEMQRTNASPQAEPHALNHHDHKLRDSISQLAAEMVLKTATAEGENSAIHALLKDAPSQREPSQNISLAGRIKQMKS